jgi:predicted AAA+ superfamily ATPase
MIVRALAARRNIALAEDELDRRALSWAQRQRGRSGRSARQFMDHLVGELALP